MTDHKCKTCDVPLTRDRWPDDTPKMQQTTEWHEGTVTIHEMWSCPRCKSTWCLNGQTRPMTEREARELDILITKYGVA